MWVYRFAKDETGEDCYAVGYYVGSSFHQAGDCESESDAMLLVCYLNGGENPFGLEPIIPVVVNAYLTTNRIVRLEFNTPLDQSIMPVPTSFVLTLGNKTFVTQTAVFFDPTSIQLTVTANITGSGTLALTYTSPTTNWLRALSGIVVQSFLNFPVTPLALGTTTNPAETEPEPGG